MNWGILFKKMSIIVIALGDQVFDPIERRVVLVLRKVPFHSFSYLPPITRQLIVT